MPNQTAHRLSFRLHALHWRCCANHFAPYSYFLNCLPSINSSSHDPLPACTSKHTHHAVSQSPNAGAHCGLRIHAHVKTCGSVTFQTRTEESKGRIGFQEACIYLNETCFLISLSQRHFLAKGQSLPCWGCISHHSPTSQRPQERRALKVNRFSFNNSEWVCQINT